jgi:phosphatidylinositol alpha-1,6-mannosyltransferase
MTMPTRRFAAVTLDARGGGIAAVSRLLWRAVADAWPEESELVTLMPPSASGAARPSALAKARFAADVLTTHVRGTVRWTLYSHLALARLQPWLHGRLARPYAIFLHGIEAWRPLSSTDVRAVTGASLLIANSSYTARRLRATHRWIGPIAECALALPDVPVRAFSRPSTPPTVLIVARMSAAERYKGHDQLLEAWPAVRSRIPGARLLVVGDGDDASRLKGKAAALGLGDSVIFTGFVADAVLDDIYEKASVFAMPSRDEGFGLVYLEAMRRGLPCIGSIHDAAADVIVDGQTGYLVDQVDVDALADRIVHLLETPSLGIEMGARGRERLAQCYGYERFRHTLVGLLSDAFESGRRAYAVGAKPAGVSEAPRHPTSSR